MVYNPYTEMLMNQGDYNSAFNAAEAEINRNWSEYMSNTQHQRETVDLLAAGINPILSANSGAQWTAVGNGASDSSFANTLANNQAQIAMTKLNNEASLKMSEINAAATKAAAGATAAATMAAAATSAEATRFAAQKNYDTATESARIGADVTARGQDVNALTSGGIPGLVNSIVRKFTG